MIEKDPVCGMPVDTKRAGSSLSFQYNGRTYYFCSHYCREHFEAEPEHYITARLSPASSQAPEKSGRSNPREISPHVRNVRTEKEIIEKGGETE